MLAIVVAAIVGGSGAVALLWEYSFIWLVFAAPLVGSLAGLSVAMMLSLKRGTSQNHALTVYPRVFRRGMV